VAEGVSTKPCEQALLGRKADQFSGVVVGLGDAAGCALSSVLTSIPKRTTTILASSRKRPWTPDGFGSSFNKAKIDAGLADRDLHFHDLRGTAATRFYVAGLSERAIADWAGRRTTCRASSGDTWMGQRPSICGTFCGTFGSARDFFKVLYALCSARGRGPEIALNAEFIGLYAWSGRRESNPRMQLGKLPFYH